MSARVAVVGFGLAGAVFHAPLIDATPGLEVAGIVTTDPDRRARASARFPAARLLGSADEIWADPAAYDLVVVCAPNRTHVPLALRAVESGLPFVVDKPVAATVAGASRLRAAAAEHAVPVAVFQNRRWDGDFLTLRALLDRGELGPVHRFESRFERWRPEVVRAWRESADPDDAGGALYDLGSHLVDQALVLFGAVEAVYAELRTVRPGARVDDDTFVALTHANGTISHLWMSLAAAAVGPRMRVLGDRAAYVKHGLDVQEQMLREGVAIGSAGWAVEPEERWGDIRTGDRTRPVRTENGRYDEFYARVAAALAHGEPMPVPLDDAIAALRVLEAAQLSAREHRVVPVEH